MKTKRIIYWGSTGLVSLLALMSAGMYLFNYEEISTTIEALGFPLFIIYPLAIAKILGVIAITTRKVSLLTEWAYAGFTFNFLLAFGAHFMINDNEFAPALAALALLLISYFLGKSVRHN